MVSSPEEQRWGPWPGLRARPWGWWKHEDLLSSFIDARDHEWSSKDADLNYPSIGFCFVFSKGQKRSALKSLGIQACQTQGGEKGRSRSKVKY